MRSVAVTLIVLMLLPALLAQAQGPEEFIRFPARGAGPLGRGVDVPVEPGLKGWWWYGTAVDSKNPAQPRNLPNAKLSIGDLSMRLFADGSATVRYKTASGSVDGMCQVQAQPRDGAYVTLVLYDARRNEIWKHYQANVAWVPGDSHCCIEDTCCGYNEQSFTLGETNEMGQLTNRVPSYLVRRVASFTLRPDSDPSTICRTLKPPPRKPSTPSKPRRGRQEPVSVGPGPNYSNKWDEHCRKKGFTSWPVPYFVTVHWGRWNVTVSKTGKLVGDCSDAVRRGGWDDTERLSFRSVGPNWRQYVGCDYEYIDQKFGKCYVRYHYNVEYTD